MESPSTTSKDTTKWPSTKFKRMKQRFSFDASATSLSLKTFTMSLPRQTIKSPSSSKMFSNRFKSTSLLCSMSKSNTIVVRICSASTSCPTSASAAYTFAIPIEFCSHRPEKSFLSVRIKSLPAKLISFVMLSEFTESTIPSTSIWSETP